MTLKNKLEHGYYVLIVIDNYQLNNTTVNNINFGAIEYKWMTN